MTPEKVIEFAKQTICYDKHDKLFWGDSEQIQAFAQLVRNGTLEEAAKHCEKYAVEVAASGDASLYADKYASGGTHCAAGIRSLK